MANATANLGLVLPFQSEAVSVTTQNDNLTVIDTAVNGLQDGMAILANGNTHAAIASGQYVYVRNHSSLSEGLYKATAAIATNGTLSTSNLTADTAGGLNDLKTQIDALNSKTAVYTLSSGQELLTVALDNTIVPINSVRWINPRAGSVAGGATQFGMACVTRRADANAQVIIYADNGTQFVNSYNNANNTWRGWESLATNSKRTFDTASIVLTALDGDLIDPDNAPAGLAIGATTVNFNSYPSDVGGNSGMILSKAIYNGSEVLYGMQIFMSFGSTKIAVRNHPYGTQHSWSAWRVI